MREAKKGERDKYEYVAREKAELDDLECSWCGKFICKTYADDLNGSYFYCVDCYNKLPDYFFP